MIDREADGSDSLEVTASTIMDVERKILMWRLRASCCFIR